MGLWDEQFFQDALRRKQAIQQQQADTATQDVSQRPEIQARSDAAAMARAKLASDTSLQSQTMQNQGAADVAGINAQSRQDVANIGEAGANARTGLTTSTQRDIAGMEDRTRREQLAQQGQQFDRSYGLDVAKSLDASRRGWADLKRPTYGAPEYNLESKQYEPTIKVPAATSSAVNPLESLQGAQGARATAADARQGGLGDETPEDIRRRRITAAAGASGSW